MPRPFEGAQWYSDLPDGHRVTYDRLGVAQLTFLSLLANGAYQNFTYTCVDSVAVYDSFRQSSDKAIVLMGQNNIQFEFDNHHNNQTEYETVTLKDECKERDKNEEKRTVVEVRVRHGRHLPITDFMARDYGQEGQAFGFEVGPVCFV